MEDELSDLLERSTADETTFFTTDDKIPMYENDNAETFDKLLNELDSYDWKISFKDFPTLTKMKIILLCMYPYLNEKNRDLYEKLAKAGYFSKEHFDTDEKIELFANLNSYVIPEMSDEYYMSIIDLIDEVALSNDRRYKIFEATRAVEFMLRQGASEKLMLKMLHSKSCFVRKKLAESSVTTREIIDALADDSSAFVKAGLAERYGDLPEDVLMKLATNIDNPSIINSLCKRPNLPESVMIYLAENASSKTSCVKNLCYIKNLSQNAIRKFSNSSSWVVRKAVAQRYDAPADVIAKLMTDESSYVREAARMTNYRMASQQTNGSANESIDVYSIYTKILSESNELRENGSRDCIQELEKEMPGIDGSAMLIALAMKGHADMEEELTDLLIRSKNLEHTYLNVHNESIDELNRLIDVLDDYNWIVSFKDFRSLPAMKDLLLVCMQRFDVIKLDAQDHSEQLDILISHGFFNDMRFAEAQNRLYLYDFASIDNMSSMFYEKLYETVRSRRAELHLDLNEIDYSLIMNKSIPDNVIEKLMPLYENGNNVMMSLLAERAGLSEEIIRMIARIPSDDVRSALAKSASTLPADVIDSMIDEGTSSPFYRTATRAIYKLLNRHDLSNEQLIRLSKLDLCGETFSYWFASRKDLPAEAVKNLANRCSSRMLRDTLLSRDDLPEDLRNMLSRKSI
jgi:hypothetical protein